MPFELQYVYMSDFGDHQYIARADGLYEALLGQLQLLAYPIDKPTDAPTPAPATYSHDLTIRALRAAISTLDLALANSRSDRAGELIDQALQHIREAVKYANAAMIAEAD